jgi:hypothetical protein
MSGSVQLDSDSEVSDCEATAPQETFQSESVPSHVSAHSVVHYFSSYADSNSAMRYPTYLTFTPIQVSALCVVEMFPRLSKRLVVL